MPQAKQPKASPVKVTSAHDVHVKDCLVWPDPSQKKPQAQNKQTTYVPIKKGDLGRPADRGYSLEQPPLQINNPLDDDHVIDALRGWPNSKVAKTQDENIFHDTALEHEACRSRSKKKDKGTKKANKRVTLDSNQPDAHIADLISHRFLSDAAKARQREEARRTQLSQQQAKKERERRFPTSIKGTKATQLRSIALAERVEKTAFDLWQIPRFSNNARPAIDTNSGVNWRQKSAPVGRANGKHLDVTDYAYFEKPLSYRKNGTEDEVGYPDYDLPHAKPTDNDYFHYYPREDYQMFGLTAQAEQAEQEAQQQRENIFQDDQY